VGRDLALDAAGRRVLLRVPFQAGDTLHLIYRTLPVALAAVYGEAPQWAAPDTAAEPRYASLAPVSPPRAATPEVGPAPPAPTPPADGPRLDIAGSKSLVVESGALGDATIRQSLDVRASGTLGGGVDLTAVLSDRDAPVTAGGGTLDLQEIDQVLVEARHEKGLARLGDLTLRQDLGQYGRYERRGSGAHLEGRLPSASASGSLAESKGRTASLRLVGDDGRQGPYALTDESGASPVAVVSGSETVWLDGVRMSHGESADYSIDYARGTVTFTPRHPIAAGARIAVDYQIAETPYARLASRAAASARRGGLELFGHAFREADDASQPSSGAYGTAEEESLATAGDTPDSAQVLPTDHTLFGGGARLAAGAWLTLEGELAASRYDANRLSSLDDDDNQGSAWRAGAVLSPRLALAGRALGALELSAAAERVDPTFVPAGRTRSPLFADEWGMGQNQTAEGGDTRQVALGYRPLARLELRGERGSLTGEGGFASDRWRWIAGWSGPFSHRLRVDRVHTSDTTAAPGARTSGHRDYLDYRNEWRVRAELVPGFRYTHDELVPPGTSPGERRAGWEASLAGEWRGFGWLAAHGRRTDDALGGESWREESRSQEWRGELRAPLGREASATLGGSHRVADYPNGAQMTSDNGSARLAFGSWGARHEAAVEWSAEGAPVRLPELRFAGAGEGSFDSLGNVSPGGGYQLEYRESPDSLVRLSVGRLAYRAEWTVGGASGGGLRLLTTVQSSGTRRGQLESRLFFALPHVLASDPDVAAGAFLFRQEVRARQSRAADWTFRFERAGQAERQTVGYSEWQTAWSEEVSVRWRWAPAWTWEGRLGGAQRDGAADTPLESWSRQLDEWGAEGILTLSSREVVALAGRVEWIAFVPRGEPAAPAASALRLGPRLTWTIAPRARLEGETLWAPGLASGTWPAVVPSAARSGWERLLGRVDFSYRLRSHGVLGFEWLARALPGQDVVHTARGELRAYF
jgi:hypothetical protein